MPKPDPSVSPLLKERYRKASERPRQLVPMPKRGDASPPPQAVPMPKKAPLRPSQAVPMPKRTPSRPSQAVPMPKRGNASPPMDSLDSMRSSRTASKTADAMRSRARREALQRMSKAGK